ncbi:MAG: F0F1 ATP synthase subunit A [Labilithrix sp.]|nr:F0F1 ATP synthase subunit A [Labilithrix sp.]MCW5830926.1 F0F1 ATP synthase subunit A [Labilithrix sp.]
MNPFPTPLWSIGPVTVTDSVLVMIVLSLLLVGGGSIALRLPRARAALELGYDTLERSIVQSTSADAQALVPLVLTLWIFLGVANVVSLVPGVATPTRDLSLAAALAAISFSAGHVHALRAQGVAYLRHYLEPSPFLLPFNVIGEIGRTIALALRLFGNMLSGHLVVAIVLYLAGLLLPVPLMLLGVLTGLVQAYIFGVLTLVFAASSIRQVEAETARKGREKK